MFCKWCGGNLSSSDIKCRCCGREVPALSDCGGFYDLVSSVKKDYEVQSVSVTLPERTDNSAKKNSLLDIILLSFALILSVAVLLLIIANHQNNMSINETNVSEVSIQEVEHTDDSSNESSTDKEDSYDEGDVVVQSSFQESNESKPE